MGDLLIESSINNKYGELNEYLINIMTLGHNCYPKSKASAYTMFCKYVPERIKNKNESMNMCDRPATGVSFHQRVTPIDGPPISGTIFTTEDMINCYKYGRGGHISPL